MTGAAAIVKCLELEKVDFVFGYPGVAICPFYDSLEDSEIRSILVRTEQNAAHEANGYARISGKPGVCAVTSGPGATNIITGIATAFADSIPLVVITGQVESALLGSDVFQEADICGACESFVKYSYTVRNVSRRKFQYPEEVKMRTYKPTVQGNPVQIKKMFQRLAATKRPILCVGGGVHLADAKERVRAFSKKFNIPVVCTMMGLGVMEENDPLFFGMVGNNGKPYGNKAMNHADLIIMMGARVADRSISQPDLITDNKTLIHIDVDPAEIGKNAGPEIPLVGDIASVLDACLEEEGEFHYSSWISELENIKGEIQKVLQKKKEEGMAKNHLVHPEYFLEELNKQLNQDAVYVADVGQNQLWSCANYQMKEGHFLTSGGMGTMGYSTPAAIGAYLADSKKQVVAVMGDGSFQMSMMELATMKQYNIPIKLIVFHNGGLGLVHQYQHKTYHDRFTMVDLTGNPDLSILAKAYGLSYDAISKNEEVSSKITAFLSKKEGGILEVYIDSHEVA